MRFVPFTEILTTLFAISEQAGRLRAELEELSDSLHDDEREYLTSALSRIENRRATLLRMIDTARYEH
jgi:hypothetical protein